MKNYAVLLFVCLFFLGLYSCKKKEAASRVPAIGLVEMFPDTLQSGMPFDSIMLQISIKDGDGDIGQSQDQQQNYDIYIKDARIDSFVGYFFPVIDEEVKNSDMGLEGNIYFFLLGSMVFTRDDSIHTITGDTTEFEIYVKDIAGNESNHITTGTVYIRP